MMRKLFRRVSLARTARRGSRPPASFRPTIEGLEIRALLSANSFLQTNIDSDIAGIAQNTDPNLVNPWGLAASPTGPFWVSDNGAGVSTIYNAQGATQLPPVTVPPPNGSPAGTKAAPTGVVFNGTGGFQVTGP